ncbi:MAG: protein-ADP-ribose hydrolase [Oscillospiraceae bacterium]|nr:protein-ADP-ribose hydrolase [Oscillospiraceae bacterium]
MKQNERLLYLIKNLLSEDRKYEKIPIPESEEERFKLLRSLMNIRPPKPVSEEFLAVQDEFLKEKIYSKGITDITDLVPVENGIYLWKGDITTLKCGAIVNAANSQMLGCFQPCHSCIDNVIHTFAGVQLRLECADIMDRQGIEEPTGTAKITSAYNLPCDHIIHTVGPIVSSILTEKHCRQLESCYRSCLEAAMQNNVTSIAFCCISTGVFGFPQKEAAEIAVKTVRKFRKNHNIEVIFNVFTENDYTIYSGLLG